MACDEHPGSVGRDNIIDAFSSSMASTLECIASIRTRCCSSITRTHEYGIGIVAKVVGPSIISLAGPARVNSGWDRKPETTRREGIWNRFEGKDGSTVSKTYHGPKRAT